MVLHAHTQPLFLIQAKSRYNVERRPLNVHVIIFPGDTCFTAFYCFLFTLTSRDINNALL